MLSGRVSEFHRLLRRALPAHEGRCCATEVWEQTTIWKCLPEKSTRLTARRPDLGAFYATFVGNTSVADPLTARRRTAWRKRLSDGASIVHLRHEIRVEASTLSNPAVWLTICRDSRLRRSGTLKYQLKDHATLHDGRPGDAGNRTTGLTTTQIESTAISLIVSSSCSCSPVGLCPPSSCSSPSALHRCWFHGPYWAQVNG